MHLAHTPCIVHCPQIYYLILFCVTNLDNAVWSSPLAGMEFGSCLDLKETLHRVENQDLGTELQIFNILC